MFVQSSNPQNLSSATDTKPINPNYWVDWVNKTCGSKIPRQAPLPELKFIKTTSSSSVIEPTRFSISNCAHHPITKIVAMNISILCIGLIVKYYLDSTIS